MCSSNPSPNLPGSGDWDPDQLRVIRCPAESRVVVEAGPGTGKTAVACARLAHLIEEADLEPSSTWMISFTRTAVAEIRARLHSFVGDSAFSIRIATIDSHAWAIHSGHDATASLTGYDENIRRVIELLAEDEDVRDELDRIEHLVIDEAQDIVGLRAILIETLIDQLPPRCGITVFADEAQAIYGFADDEQEPDSDCDDASSLLDQLRSRNDTPFETLSLQQVHRTSSEGLREIFSTLRRFILDKKNHEPGFHERTADRIREHADETCSWMGKQIDNYSSDDLLLFRTRAEVLQATQFCKGPHRLRLSGFGATIPAWLAICFWDFVEQFLGETEFLSLWTERIERVHSPERGPAEAWTALQCVAGRPDGSIDMLQLRRLMSRPRPPTELSIAEFGLPGPLAGTIHASKGREAPNVLLVTPKSTKFRDLESEVEEARVLFVGATRARESLTVATGTRIGSVALDSGRRFRTYKSGSRAQIEVGRDEDLRAPGLVGRTEFSEEEALEAQERLARVADVLSKFDLETDAELDWRYRVIDPADETCVGVLSKNLNHDLWDAIRNHKEGGRGRPPKFFKHVPGLGSSSMVLGPDDEDLQVLHEPWASSGFLLVPRIVGFPMYPFSRKK
jgi:hypothetical protein